ncbi:hypothetical protein V2J09_013105 [Rumex salicifolius]
MKCLPLLHLVYLASLLYITISTDSVEARKSYGHSHKHSHNHNARNLYRKHHKTNTSSSCAPPPTLSNVFSVLSFGAKGDGITDDSKAIVAAWTVACSVEGATVLIPSGLKLFIKPITLEGPCMGHLTLQIDGTIIAPSRVSSWPKSGLFQWINFKWLHSFTIQGSGIVDGRGYEWWSSYSLTRKDTDPFQEELSNKRLPDMKPTALRFYASYNVMVRDITITNSPLCHLKFDNSRGVIVDNITISSPENSLNTDGIHLQNTRDVEIQHSSIATGDDCVSIQTGCSNVHIHNLNCGPGHGISLGGLGKDKSLACVSDIMVEDIFMQNTLYGARIKTWQGGIGLVKNVTFSNIQMSNVRVPVMIDQFYCDKGHCKNQTGGVAISDVKFNQITGTYSFTPLQLACNNNVPCVNVDMLDIQLKPVSGKRFGFQEGVCWNSYGKSRGPMSPSSIDDCLQRGSDVIRRVERSRERAFAKP